MKAIQIVKSSQDNWFTQVALNYSQLNFDHGVIGRVGNTDFDFYVCNNFTKLQNYEYILVVPCGYILAYNFFEQVISPQITGDYEFYYFPNNRDVFVWCPNGKGIIDLDTDHIIPFVNPSTQNTFSTTHDSVVQLLIHHSNLSYVIHNEIPDPKPANKEIEWAMTVSSGFYINYVLERNGFANNADIHHLDISKPSLYVREYTIKNWDGHNFFEWLDHLYKKFPMLELYNGKHRFHSHDRSAIKCWSHVEDTFGNSWIDHWKKYQNCNHYFHNCNLGDNAKFSKILEKHSPANKNSAIWWNGGLKRLPANILKTSEQSSEMVRTFLTSLDRANPNTLVYGSDHCAIEFNGINASKALELVNKKNSRAELWKNL